MTNEQRGDNRSDRARQTHHADDRSRIGFENVEPVSMPPATAQAPDSRYGAVMDVIGGVARWLFKRVAQLDRLSVQLQDAEKVADSVGRHNTLYRREVALSGSLNDGVAQGNESDQVATGVSKWKQMLVELARKSLVPLEEKLSKARGQLGEIAPRISLEEPHESMRWVRELSAREMEALSQALDSYYVAANELTQQLKQINTCFAILNEYSASVKKLQTERQKTAELTIEDQKIAGKEDDRRTILARLKSVRGKVCAVYDSCLQAADLSALPQTIDLSSQQENVSALLSFLSEYVIPIKNWLRWAPLEKLAASLQNIETSATMLEYEERGGNATYRPEHNPVAMIVGDYREHQRVLFDELLSLIEEKLTPLVDEGATRVRAESQEGTASLSAAEQIRHVEVSLCRLLSVIDGSYTLNCRSSAEYLGRSHDYLNQLTSSVLELENWGSEDSETPPYFAQMYKNVYRAYCRWLISRWESEVTNSQETQSGRTPPSSGRCIGLKDMLSNRKADLEPLQRAVENVELERKVAKKLKEEIAILSHKQRLSPGFTDLQAAIRVSLIVDDMQAELLSPR